MKRIKKDFKIFNSIKAIGIFFIFIPILFVSIGYSAFRKDLIIEKIVSYVGGNINTKITNVIVEGTSDVNTYANSIDFSHNILVSSLHLDNSDSWIKYEISVRNFGDEEAGIKEYIDNILPDELEYEIEGYTLGDVLCDDLDNTKCTLNSLTTIYLTIRYSEQAQINTPANYMINIELDFEVFHTVTYSSGICASNCPSKVLNGATLNANLINYNILSVYVSNLLLASNEYSFNNATGEFTLSNVTGNVNIENTNYTKILYIETTGSPDNQYIDTLYRLNANTHVVYDGMTISGDTALFGARRASSGAHRFTFQYTKELIYRVSFGINNYEASNIYEKNTRYLFKMNMNQGMINNDLIGAYSTPLTYSNIGNLYLFAINTNNQATNFGVNRLYSFKIFEGTTLVKNFIPVLDRDNVPCLYETIGEDFYYNRGDGTFNYSTIINHTVTNNVSYLVSSNLQPLVTYGESYITTYTPTTGHTLPLKLRIIAGDVLLTENLDYEYNTTTGELVIHFVTSDIIIDEIKPITLDYLASTGTQYINTGYIPTVNTKVVFTHIPLVSTYTPWIAFFGTKDSDTNSNSFYVSTGVDMVSAFVGGLQVSNGNYPFLHTIGAIQAITLSSSELKVVENGVHKFSRNNQGNVSFSDPGEIYIFGRNANGPNYLATLKVKSFQIYENEVLQMDLVPKMDINGEYCFYDNISEEYFYNEGTGSFTGL